MEYGKGGFCMQKKWCKRCCGCVALALFTVAMETPLTEAAGSAGALSNVWYAQAAAYAQEKDLFPWLEGEFHPDAPMSRAMLAASLVSFSENADPEDFTDTPGLLSCPDIDFSAWYSHAARWALRAGVITGKNGLFNPSGTITREEAALALFRYAQRTGNLTGSKALSGKVFSDGAAVSPWAREAVEWAAGLGLLQGYPNGALLPQKGLSLAEAACMFQNAEKLLPKRKVIYPMTATADNLGITAENYPRVDGSKLTQTLASKMYHEMYGFSDPNGYQHTSTIPAYEKLIRGETDLILVPSVPKDISQKAEEAGVVLASYEIAKGGFVFLTPRENKVSNLTMEQAQAIYREKSVSSWEELGGESQELVPLRGDRETNDMQLQLEQLILKGSPCESTVLNGGSISELCRKTAYFHTDQIGLPVSKSYALGFGYFGAPSPELSKDALKVLSFEGVAPTRENIADETYPLTFHYYAVIRDDLLEDHPARTLAQWLQTREGKACIQKSGLGLVV